MNLLMESVIYGIGWSVCVVGGIGIGSVLTIWAIDRLLKATGNTAIVAQWWVAKKFPNRFKG